jgi:hypothetical protein
MVKLFGHSALIKLDYTVLAICVYAHMYLYVSVFDITIPYNLRERFMRKTRSIT